MQPATLTADCPGEKLQAGTSSPVVPHRDTCVVCTVHVLLLEPSNLIGDSQLLVHRKGLF